MGLEYNKRKELTKILFSAGIGIGSAFGLNYLTTKEEPLENLIIVEQNAEELLMKISSFKDPKIKIYPMETSRNYPGNPLPLPRAEVRKYNSNHPRYEIDLYISKK